jgi:glycosyltransferase involved in cell wall biosynthesis/GNAT superfamily N-acetyltransferase
MEHIVYKTNTASLFQIEEHLNLCSDNFIEKLSERINIKEYSIKIKENAVTFEAWYNEQLVGLIACYANNIDSGIAFITNVSVLKDFQSKGIAHNLLKNLQSDELIKKFRIVQLLVDVDNYSAISLYKKNGFFLDRKHGNQSFMTYYTNPKNPLVSICCVTYNHEPYIHDCLNGFIMQKTNFPFEVLIHDDASTDKTADIIREYEAKYPNIIKPVYQSENQFSKKVGINITYQFPRAKGKYIALCEGDDYWTDPLKLQKQVDFLEANEEYSACGHTAKVLYENTGREELYPDITENKTCTYQHTIEKWIMTTASIVFRNNIEVFDKMEKIYSYRNIISGDQILLATLGHIGDILIMHEAMSVYRKHDGGISNWGDPKEIWKDHIYMFKIFKKIFNSKFNYVLNYRILIKYCNISINELKHKRYFSYLKYTIKGFTFIRTWIDFKTWFGLLILRKDYSKT